MASSLPAYVTAGCIGAAILACLVIFSVRGWFNWSLPPTLLVRSSCVSERAYAVLVTVLALYYLAAIAVGWHDSGSDSYLFYTVRCCDVCHLILRAQ